MPLVAVDIAILPPADVADLAIRLSASLPAKHSQGLRLGTRNLPHVTLAQLFVNDTEIDGLLDALDAIVLHQHRVRLHVPGGARGASSVWMGIDLNPGLESLHRQIMDRVAPFEQTGGTSSAFDDGEARPGDVQWVTNYRSAAAYERFRPHITLGHAPAPPHISAFGFVADTVAVCRLGKFCTCRDPLRQWRLGPPAG